MLHVFCNTADVIITKTLLLGDVVEVVVVQVVVGIQHVQSFTCTHPDQSTRVFVDLCDVVVGEHLCMGDITCEHPFLRVGEVEYHQSFGSTDIEVVLLVILIGVEFYSKQRLNCSISYLIDLSNVLQCEQQLSS